PVIQQIAYLDNSESPRHSDCSIKFGNPGAVIARLTSVDQSGDFAFDVPIKDPLAEVMRVGGSYPWRLDKGFTTILHLKNTIAKPVFALVQVRTENQPREW